MNNLHKIHNEIPDWVKLVILAYNTRNKPWQYDRVIRFKYNFAKNTLEVQDDSGFNFTRGWTETKWRSVGWEPLMQKENITKFDPAAVIIE